MRTLELLVRRHCGLCEDAQWALDQLGLPPDCALVLIDVDTDDALARAYGLRVPVLRLAGRELAAGRLDPDTLAAVLRSL